MAGSPQRRANLNTLFELVELLRLLPPPLAPLLLRPSLTLAPYPSLSTICVCAQLSSDGEHITAQDLLSILDGGDESDEPAEALALKANAVLESLDADADGLVSFLDVSRAWRLPPLHCAFLLPSTVSVTWRQGARQALRQTERLRL